MSLAPLAGSPWPSSASSNCRPPGSGVRGTAYAGILSRGKETKPAWATVPTGTESGAAGTPTPGRPVDGAVGPAPVAPAARFNVDFDVAPFGRICCARLGFCATFAATPAGVAPGGADAASA